MCKKYSCKVSVIIPYYNRENTILRALNSVKDQTFKDFEIILIDDGSTDSGTNLVKKYMKNNPNINFKLIYQKNSGPSKARNEGIKISKGEYVAFLDSDDSWEKNKLEIQIKFMDKNKDIDITTTNYYIRSKGKIFVKENNNEECLHANFYKMLFKNFFCTPMVVIRKKVIDFYKFKFDENKKYAEDHLFFLDIVRKCKGAKITKPLGSLYKFEYGQGGLSSALKELTLNEYDNFTRLYKDNKNNTKKINFLLYCMCLAVASGKHFKRKYKVWNNFS